MADDELVAESLAQYLARAYVIKDGFEYGVIPEAETLSLSSDIVLTRRDEVSIQIICFVDGETHSWKKFELPIERLIEIGKLCRFNGNMRRRVSLQIIETSTTPRTAGDKARLMPIKHSVKNDVIAIGVWHIETGNKTVWTNNDIGIGLSGCLIRDAMIKLRLTDDELRPRPIALVAEKSSPVLTYILLAVLAAIFAVEVSFGTLPLPKLMEPDLKTLVALGASGTNQVVVNGQWYRLFSAPLLHLGLVHVLMNSIALLVIGRKLESLIGRLWFGAIFVLCALGGGAVSLLLLPAGFVAVGASGGVLGLIAAGMVFSFRYPPGADRNALQRLSIAVLILSLGDLLFPGSGAKVDFGGHLGGAVSGLVIACLVFWFWSKKELRPRFSRIAWVISIVGISGAVFAGYRAFEGRGLLALASQMISDAEMPKTNAERMSKNEYLLAKYPNDPRPHLMQSGIFYDVFRYADAESEAIVAQEKYDAAKPLFLPAVARSAHILQALSKAKLNRLDDARSIIRPYCVETLDLAVRKEVNRLGLCN